MTKMKTEPKRFVIEFLNSTEVFKIYDRELGHYYWRNKQEMEYATLGKAKNRCKQLNKKYPWSCEDWKPVLRTIVKLSRTINKT